MGKRTPELRREKKKQGGVWGGEEQGSLHRVISFVHLDSSQGDQHNLKWGGGEEATAHPPCPALHCKETGGRCLPRNTGRIGGGPEVGA